MENAQQCRAIALLCRQQASIHPQDSWKWLAQAERWEHLAHARLVLKADTSKPSNNPAGRSANSAETNSAAA
jgi:hypothetical protein